MSASIARPLSADAAKDPLPSRVLGHVFLGSKAHARSRDVLASLRISHILNCTPPKSYHGSRGGCANYYEREDAALTYLRIPVFDNAGENITPFIREAVDFIDRAQFYGNVLVHCNKGVSRSPSFVIAYLMEKNDFTLEEALDYVRSCRPAANPNASFIEQLRKYETALINGRAISSREGQATVERAVAGPSLGPLPAAPQQLRQQEEEEQAVRMEAEADGGLRSSSNVIPTQPPDLTGKILNGSQRVIVIDTPKHPDILYPIRNNLSATLRAASDSSPESFAAGDGDARPPKRSRWENDD